MAKLTDTEVVALLTQVANDTRKTLDKVEGIAERMDSFEDELDAIKKRLTRIEHKVNQ